MMLARILVVAALAVTVFVAPVRAVEVKEVTGESGVTAWLVEDHANPIISFRFAFSGGAALDPEGRGGLANMVSGLLDEGAGDLDSQMFQQALEEKSIRLGFSAGKDTFSGNVTTLTDNAADAWLLLRSALTAPRFDEEPVERIRSQILASLRHRSTDPNSIAGRKLFDVLFDEHPYAVPTDGTEESVSAITTADLRGFVEQRLARDNLVIGVVGDITADELATVIDDVFGALPAKAQGTSVAKTSAPSNGAMHIIEKAVPQSTILFSQPGPERRHEDFIPLYVMNYLLGGGGFTSRLYTEVREKRGLAYSVYSYLAPYDHAAIISGGAGTSNERVAETIAVIREQWSQMASDGVSAEELADAKTYLTGSYPLRFTSSGNIADMLVGLQLDDFESTYFDTRNALIDAVTLEDINRVAAKWLNTDSLTFVIVGQPEGVDSDG